MSSQKPAWRRAEEWVAEEYDLDHEPGEPGERWYDAINPRTGTKYQVKSAEPGGAFRLWSDQHRSLTACEGQKCAWYVFVSSDGRSRRVRPSTVTRWVRERGGWVEAGHELRPGAKQHKLDVDDVLNQ